MTSVVIPCRCGATGCSTACTPTSIVYIDPHNDYERKPNRKDRRTYLKFLPKKVGTK